MKHLGAVNWIVFVALETFAQISLKLAAVDVPPGSGLGAWVQALTSNGWFQASIAADVVNFFAWMLILRRHDLSLAVPLSSFCYVTIVLASTFLLQETVTALQLLGLGLVGIGIVLVADQEPEDSANAGQRDRGQE
jgi:drug/metabolite transporter (DMT)-like permease